MSQHSLNMKRFIFLLATVALALASATECAEISASKVDAVLKTATQLTFFSENGVTYQVAAIAKLAGDICGAA